MLHTNSSVKTAYDAKSGIKRTLGMSGRIDDPYQNPIGDISEHLPGSAFHGKLVRFTIYSWTDQEWMEEIRDTPSISHACGLVSIRVGVEPEKFEIDGENFEVEPILILLAVGADTFEAITRQISVAENHRRIMMMSVTLIGDSLPKTNNRVEMVAGLPLKNLDVSKPRDYWVRSFEVSDSALNPVSKRHNYVA